MNEHYIEVPCNAEVVIRVSCKKMPTLVEEPVKPDYLKDLDIVDTIRFPPELFNPPVVTIDPIDLPAPVEPILVIDPVIEQPVEVPVEPVVEPILVIDPVEIPTEPVAEIPVIVNPVVEVPVTEPVTEPIVVVEPTPDPVIPSDPVVVVDPVINPVQTLDPTPVVTEPVAEVPVVLPPVLPEHCFCKLDSPLSLADFTKQLGILTKGLLYPSESDFPIEVIAKSFSSRMPPIKGIELRTLDRVIPGFLRSIDPDDQQTGNVERAALATRWQGLYQFIKTHASVTAWHYPVKGKRYTHELFVLLLHPQGTVALKIRLVET
jgi:hypothetical protein